MWSYGIMSLNVKYSHLTQAIFLDTLISPFLFHREVVDCVTRRQYPSMRSAKLSATSSDGQVMVSVSVVPATRSCTMALRCTSQSDTNVWMACILSNSAIRVGCNTKHLYYTCTDQALKHHQAFICNLWKFSFMFFLCFKKTKLSF